MKKKLLIYAHYYYPDVASTGQLLKDLAEGLTGEFDVTVICVVPSYTGKVEEYYKTKRIYIEKLNSVNVLRVRVPEFDKSKKISRIRNIVSYFFGALFASSKVGKQDYILAISQPPILGGMLGVCGKLIKRAKLIYCIQDFNPEQVVAVNYIKNKLILSIMMHLDKFNCKKSDLVVTVGRDLIETLENRFKGRNVPPYTLINNWIDEKEVYPLSADNPGVVDFKRQYGLENKFIIMYSGNIGLYYDLENILRVIESIKTGTTSSDGREVVFVFVGEGSILEKLKDYKREKNLENVVFIPYQPKEKLIYNLNAADIHWCVNSSGIKGVSCPSKFYGIVACAKPVLAVLEEGSEIRLLVEKTGCGYISNPGDYWSIEQNLREAIDATHLANMGNRGYDYFKASLTKKSAIDKYCASIKKL